MIVEYSYKITILYISGYFTIQFLGDLMIVALVKSSSQLRYMFVC